MPRNGSGTFVPIVNSWNPPINGVSATAVDWAAQFADLVAALTQSASADGQTPMSGNLNMAGNKLTNLSSGSATGDSLRYEQLFSQGLSQDLPAAATVDIGAILSVQVNVTGSATITSFGTNYNGPRFVKFAGVCTLTNSATLVVPGGVDIVTAAGDSIIALPLDNPATGWRIAVFQKLNGSIPISLGGTGGNTTITAKNSLQIADIYSINATVASNELTITANPATLDFRSPALSSGAVNTRALAAAATLVVPSAATLGTISGQLSRLVVLLLDNAGTLEPAVVNLAGGVSLDETGVISTTAISPGATSATVVYSTAARASLPYRVIGVIETTQTTAGTWISAPSKIQGVGGQALAALMSSGYGQTPQNLTGSRSFGTVFYNLTSRPIDVYVSSNNPQGINCSITATVNGVLVNGAQGYSPTGNLGLSIGFSVPPGNSYTVAATNATLAAWSEIR